MAEWVLVENNIIKEYHGTLPKSWKNISGLDKSDNSFLLSQGWYRVEKNYQSFDPNVYEIIGYEYEILPNCVVETLKLRAFTEEDINKKNKEKQDNFFNTLRSTRNQLLMKSDWTQMLDLQAIKSQEWINSWKIYRQNLRDLPTEYENVENYNLDNINWPIEPSN